MPLPTVDPETVDPSNRDRWCSAQLSSCSIVCANNTRSNQCNSETLDYICTCNDGTYPDLGLVTQTLPFFECKQAQLECDIGYKKRLCNNDPCPSIEPPAYAAAIATSSASSSSATSSTGSTTSAYVAGGSSNNGGGGSGRAWIAGPVVGVVLGLVLIVGFIWYALRLRRRKKERSSISNDEKDKTASPRHELQGNSISEMSTDPRRHKLMTKSNSHELHGDGRHRAELEGQSVQPYKWIPSKSQWER